MKRRVVLCALMSLLLLSGCGAGQGSAFSLNASIVGQVDTLDPAMAVGQANETVVLHLYENLMRTVLTPSEETELTGGAAKSYDEETNHDGTVTYTFHLHPDAKWSDGTHVTAQDFVYAWQRLVDPAQGSPNHSLLEMVQGYQEVRAGADVSELGVEAKDEDTLSVTLGYKCPYFITEVCTAAATMPVRQALVRDGWGQDWERSVTNGAYQVAALREGEYLEIKANAQYHENGSGGPESIRFYLADTVEDAYALFLDNAVDFVAPIPNQRLAERLENKLYVQPQGLSTYTVLMNNGNEAFSDPQVRRAFSLAIDRSALAGLAGPGAAAARGLVPGGVMETKEESFRSCGGDLLGTDRAYGDNCKAARESLAQAGYADGASFPAVEYLYVDEEGAAEAAQALVQMWKEQLGVQVSTRAVSGQEMEKALADGTYALAAVEITSPVADAMGFLERWESGNEHNFAGYSNSAFDTLMTVVRSATDESARVACLHDAETLLLEDAALAPLYSVGSDGESQYGFSGFYQDSMDHWHLGSVMLTLT
ncbi:peptide ABC transporter substrate-binding protein [Oscillibacter hominis]|uniref:Peptide ABC transporter substrate-binding protein n=1 Tax=Oscillibacter hominis TaxID=2763056 RepID=A0A7G9B527_9FIRM|nr:peptide ABC transporter substrate-binding protein [Oscillibacter hominis]QNL44658.1 peptide ABC transporter substrate-binding protein [Oscillibacter hominis]